MGNLYSDSLSREKREKPGRITGVTAGCARPGQLPNSKPPTLRTPVQIIYRCYLRFYLTRRDLLSLDPSLGKLGLVEGSFFERALVRLALERVRCGRGHWSPLTSRRDAKRGSTQGESTGALV